MSISIDPVEQTIEKIKEDIDNIEIEVTTKGYTLGDLIREGSKYTDQAYNWGNGLNACALSAGYLAARARGLVE